MICIKFVAFYNISTHAGSLFKSLFNIIFMILAWLVELMSQAQFPAKDVALTFLQIPLAKAWIHLFSPHNYVLNSKVD